MWGNNRNRDAFEDILREVNSSGRGVFIYVGIDGFSVKNYRDDGRNGPGWGPGAEWNSYGAGGDLADAFRRFEKEISWVEERISHHRTDSTAATIEELEPNSARPEIVEFINRMYNRAKTLLRSQPQA